MLEKIAPTLIVSVITGGVSSIGTTAAMQVHLSYIRDDVKAIERKFEGLGDRVRINELKLAEKGG